LIIPAAAVALLCRSIRINAPRGDAHHANFVYVPVILGLRLEDSPHQSQFFEK
jgi:hypothetical protein